MIDVQIRVAEDEIRDLQRIIRATEAVLEMEKSPERRTALAKELGDLKFRVDRLRQKIENLRRCD